MKTALSSGTDLCTPLLLTIPLSKVDLVADQFYRSLYGVTASVIDELYESNLGSSVTPIPPANIVSTVIHTGQKLAAWQASLPTSMRLVEPSEICDSVESPISLKFRVILTLRYHNLHILSHRPILDRCMQALDGTPQTDQETATLQQGWYLSKDACLQSAESIIRLVEACKSSSDTQPTISYLGAWWFSLYFSTCFLPDQEST